MPNDSQIARWTTAIVSVGIFVVGIFAISLRANLAALDAQLETSRSDALVFFQNQADDHADMWRRIGFLEAKIEALETMAMIETIEEAGNPPIPDGQ